MSPATHLPTQRGGLIRLMLQPNRQTFIGCEANWDEADLVLFGAPYDSTTSFRPGTRFATQAMRPDSYGLETYSPGLDLDLNDYAILDSGDLELPFGPPEPALAQIEERTRLIAQAGKFPLMIGGEHLVTLGAVRALAAQYPDLELIHLDAHTDLREDYLGNPLSHACVMRRCWEHLGDGRLHQFGIRSGLREEFQWANAGHTHLRAFDLVGLAACCDRLRETQTPVYFSLDLDVLDPSFFPGTGTPEPGGITFLQLIDGLHQLKGLNLVGADLNELSPAYDPSGVSTAVACKILRELLLRVAENRRPVAGRPS